MFTPTKKQKHGWTSISLPLEMLVHCSYYLNIIYTENNKQKLTKLNEISAKLIQKDNRKKPNHFLTNCLSNRNTHNLDKKWQITNRIFIFAYTRILNIYQLGVEVMHFKILKALFISFTIHSLFIN